MITLKHDVMEILFSINRDFNGELAMLRKADLEAKNLIEQFERHKDTLNIEGEVEKLKILRLALQNEIKILEWKAGIFDELSMNAVEED